MKKWRIVNREQLCDIIGLGWKTPQRNSRNQLSDTGVQDGFHTVLKQTTRFYHDNFDL